MTEPELDPYVEWIAREARRPVPVDAAARARLMAAVHAEPLPARPRRGWQWLVEARPLALSPLGSFAAAAGLVGIGVLAGAFGGVTRDDRTAIGRPAAVAEATRLPASPNTRDLADTARTITFVMVAPQAAKVSLVGDFNAWNASATPMVRTRTGGTWTVTVSLPRGRHLYAFVLDSTQWVADPEAPLAPADGLGAPSSVVLVGGSTS